MYPLHVVDLTVEKIYINAETFLDKTKTGPKKINLFAKYEAMMLKCRYLKEPESFLGTGPHSI